MWGYGSEHWAWGGFGYFFSRIRRCFCLECWGGWVAGFFLTSGLIGQIEAIGLFQFGRLLKVEPIISLQVGEV